MPTDKQKAALATVLRHHLFVTSVRMADLAKQFSLPTFQTSKGPDPAYFLRKFVDGTLKRDDPRIPIIFEAFGSMILSDAYRKTLPSYIQMAVREAYQEDAQLHPIAFSPINVICRIQDYNPQYLKDLRAAFEGVWDVIRFAHHGQRIVRGAMEVNPPSHDFPLPSFTVYFRTNHLTSTKSAISYKTHGSLFPLAHGLHAFFLGCEDSGYPLTIIAPLRRDAASFYGLVSRRHHGDTGVMFSIKAHFSRAKPGAKIDQPETLAKIGSWSESDPVMSTHRADILGFDEILKSLRRPLNGGGFMLDDD